MRRKKKKSQKRGVQEGSWKVLTMDLPEGLGHEVEDLAVALHHEAQGGELAAAIAHQAVVQLLGELPLEAQRL